MNNEYNQNQKNSAYNENQMNNEYNQNQKNSAYNENQMNNEYNQNQRNSQYDLNCQASPEYEQHLQNQQQIDKKEKDYFIKANRHSITNPVQQKQQQQQLHELKLKLDPLQKLKETGQQLDLNQELLMSQVKRLDNRIDDQKDSSNYNMQQIIDYLLNNRQGNQQNTQLELEKQSTAHKQQRMQLEQEVQDQKDEKQRLDMDMKRHIRLSEEQKIREKEREKEKERQKTRTCNKDVEIQTDDVPQIQKSKMELGDFLEQMQEQRDNDQRSKEQKEQQPYKSNGLRYNSPAIDQLISDVRDINRQPIDKKSIVQVDPSELSLYSDDGYTVDDEQDNQQNNYYFQSGNRRRLKGVLTDISSDHHDHDNHDNHDDHDDDGYRYVVTIHKAQEIDCQVCRAYSTQYGQVLKGHHPLCLYSKKMPSDLLSPFNTGVDRQTIKRTGSYEDKKEIKIHKGCKRQRGMYKNMEAVMKKIREKEQGILKRQLKQYKILQVNKMGQMVFRVGGGYIQFDEFIEKYGHGFLMDLYKQGALTSISSIKKAHSAKHYVLSHKMTQSQRERRQEGQKVNAFQEENVGEIRERTKDALKEGGRKFRSKQSILLDYTNRNKD